MNADSNLRAFHGSSADKAKYLSRVRSHRKAGEIVSGIFWKEGRGNAVGCTIHGSRFEDYEAELGIPQALAHLEYRLFEGLHFYVSPAAAVRLPERVLSAIRPGADLNPVWPNLALWMLIDGDLGIIRAAKKPRSRQAVIGVGALYRRWLAGDKPAAAEWKRAGEIAFSAYGVAAYAAGLAATDTTGLAAAFASGSYAAVAAVPYKQARGEHIGAMANKLIELLRAAR
jgi:hypothetical protein